MATSLEFVEYVCEQIQGTGLIRHKKMFGEYMVYVNEKPVLLVCDNTVYAKIWPALGQLCAECEKGFPYPGAKGHYVLDVDDGELLRQIAGVLAEVTPLPKAKSLKKQRGR